MAINVMSKSGVAYQFSSEAAAFLFLSSLFYARHGHEGEAKWLSQHARLTEAFQGPMNMMLGVCSEMPQA